MTTQINVNDNYGKRLRDEIVQENKNNALRGEVTVTVKDKTTGKVEEQQKHNLIVYGGREWLLKKAFATTIDCDNNDYLANSEILWFGVGSGGSEPGNPLQCGSTYGSDNDLYQPVRLRYDFDQTSTENPYYASRIMNNGDVVNGYYKKISYIGIKEDLANPYKKNNVTMYPNLVAEIRLEISTDDIAGQSYLGDQYTKTYADINELALFIADRRLADPGKDGTITSSTKDYYNFDEQNKRYYFEENGKICSHNVNLSENKLEWTSNKPFQNNNVQFFDVYLKEEVSKTEQHNHTEKDDQGAEHYYKLTTKLNDKPFLLGIYESGESKCKGYIKLNHVVTSALQDELQCAFGEYTNTLNGKSYKKTFNVPLLQKVDSVDKLLFVTHGTIFIRSDKDSKVQQYCENDTVYSTVYYRNGFTQEFKQLYPEHNAFETSDSKIYYFPIGYVYYHDGVELVSDPDFNSLSHVRVKQHANIYKVITVDEIEKDDNSTEVRFYVDNSEIDKVREGMYLYTIGDHANLVPSNNIATITEVYDAREDIGISNTVKRSYFVIDRRGLEPQSFGTTGLRCKVFTGEKDNPYTMFNRCTISTIRASRNREIVVVWRLYF